MPITSEIIKVIRQNLEKTRGVYEELKYGLRTSLGYPKINVIYQGKIRFIQTTVIKT